ncbi:MAG: sensor histidine kinase [Rhodanobacter sp.]|nr:MAG: sensor histidine kinase [Rhodanobacter sp.]
MSWPAERLRGSIRGRLLLFLFGGLGALMLVLFLLLDFSIDRQIYGRLDHRLLARAHRVVALLESHPAGEALAELQRISPEYAGGGHTDFLQIWGSGGRTVLSSASNAAATLQRPPHAVPANAPFFYDLHLPDGHHGRAVALRLAFPGSRGEATLVVAEEREQIDLLERQIHIVLLSGIAGTALLAALLAFLAVRGGLRPLLTFRADAEAAMGPRAETLPTEGMPRELMPFALALNRAFQQLHATLARERRFARDVAHELRTPLAEVRMALDLAQRDVVDSVPLQGAVVSIERMRRCVDALLALSRYESGMDRALMEPLDLVELLRKACTAAPTMPRAVSLDIKLPDEYWVVSDAALLERIVDNLLQNALEYAPERSRVQLLLEPMPGGARLRIGNDAPELEPQDLARMGERFWRKSPERDSSRHGGLGLALSQTLAEVLGLQLNFELEHGVFWAVLTPLRDIDSLDGEVS